TRAHRRREAQADCLHPAAEHLERDRTLDRMCPVDRHFQRREASKSIGFYSLTFWRNDGGAGGDLYPAAPVARRISLSWGRLIQRAGARPEDSACRWGDERNPCPVPLHQGIPPCWIVRVNARWGGGHHALTPLPSAFDQRHRLYA